MYLIHFYIKNNIKMHFSKVEFLKFQNRSDIHYPSQWGEINCIGIRKDFTTAVWSQIFQKNTNE